MKGAHAVVVGRSEIVGKPQAHLLLKEDCTVTICHSRTRDLAAIVRQADIVVAADDCRFSQLEVARGIMATGGATLRMAERAGLGNALLHLLSGDEFGSAEALRLNFVQKVVPAGQQLAEALKIAQAIAEQAPQAVVATRQNALKALEQGPVVAMQEFISVQQRLSATDDAAEGVRSFVERRPARFTGH